MTSRGGARGAPFSRRYIYGRELVSKAGDFVKEKFGGGLT